MKTTRYFLTLAVIFILTQSANAAPGDLDSAFGTGGFVTTDVRGAADSGMSVAVQSDGRIVVAGFSASASTAQVAVVRYNADGSVDPSFNGTGRAVGGFSGVLGSVFANSVAIQSDGKIVVAGTSNGSGFAVARFNSTGTLDASFTTGIGFGASPGSSAAIQSDGKIVVVGSAPNPVFNDFGVVRFTSAGSLDTTFNFIGKVTTDFSGKDDFGRAIAIQGDGKIVVAGNSIPSSNNNSFAAVRYNGNGTLDTTFNGTGKVTTDFGGSISSIANSMAIQSDGKIVVAGTSQDGGVAGSHKIFAVVRYNANGSLDTTFNGTGKLTTDFATGNDNNATSVAIQSDGKIVVVGYYNTGTALARYNINGTLDAGFGVGGKLTTVGVLNNTLNGTGSGLVIQNDGRIVVAGTYGTSGNTDFFVLRFEGLPLAPEIAVEQPAGTDLVDGAASVDFGNVLTGATVSTTR